jgi:hypothetical protein
VAILSPPALSQTTGTAVRNPSGKLPLKIKDLYGYFGAIISKSRGETQGCA